MLCGETTRGGAGGLGTGALLFHTRRSRKASVRRRVLPSDNLGTEFRAEGRTASAEMAVGKLRGIGEGGRPGRSRPCRLFLLSEI